MKTSSTEFEKLPFTKLFRDYTSEKKEILDFYETNPFSENSVDKRIQNFSFSGSRDNAAEVLRTFNEKFDAPKSTVHSIDKLAKPGSLAVVTGQQMTLFGGPVFTIYKTLTAINLARNIENKYKIPVIPVFWMADEDHDFDEVSSITIPSNKDTHSITYLYDGQGSKSSGFVTFDDEINVLQNNLKTEFLETDFSNQLWEILENCYKPGSDFGTSFGKLLLELFSDQGLILSGSNDEAVKKLIYHPMQLSVQNAEDNFEILNKTSESLDKAGYHNQVHLNKSNLFWFDNENNRIKIQYQNGGWTAGSNNISWSSGELMQEIENYPEKFSPNVFLRPIIQDQLLPTISYVAGPGEVAYYAQMKDFYRTFGKKMPVIMPRISATIIESGIDRILKKLPFEVEDYSKRIEDLESDYVSHADTPDIEKIFGEWKQETEIILEEKKTTIGEIDPTLTNSAEKVQAVLSSELDKLKGKVYRSVKEQENVQINRIKKIQNSLFPNGSLQEREIAFIYFMNKYGIDIWQRLLKELESESSRNHKIVCL